MHLPLSSLHHPVFSRRPTAHLAPGWHRARIALQAAFAEVALYLCGRQRSRLHGHDALDELDMRLRRGVGSAPNGRLNGFGGLG